jgi:hypothetical protein
MPTSSRKRALVAAAVIAVLAIVVVWWRHGRGADHGAGADGASGSDLAAAGTGGDDTPGGPVRPIHTGITGDDDPTIIAAGAPAVVEGVVRDAATKAPIPNADVAFWSKRGELTTESGADGHYKLDVTTGAWSARAATGDDGLSVALLVRVDAPHVVVDLDVQKLAHLHGVVRDAVTHAPVSGAVVSVEPAEKAVREALDATAGLAVQSGGDGSYKLSVPPGEVRLMATAPGKLGHRALPAVAPGADAVADLELRSNVSIDGHVVDGKGAGVAGAKVTVFLAIADIDLNHNRTITTGADGRFEAHGLEPGTLTLVAKTDDGGATEPKLMDISGGDLHDLVLTMSPAVAIRGHVKYSDGRAAPGAVVKVRRSGLAGLFAEAASDKDGRFELKGPSSSTYDLTASTENGTARLLGAAPDTDIELVIRIPGGIRGKVHTKTAPVADYTVAIDQMTLAGNERGQNPPPPQRYTPADGTFEWPHLDPGTYELTVRGGGAVAHVHGVAVPERDWATLDVLLDAAVGLSGRVHAGDKPIASARVDAGCTGASAITGADGDFAFPDAPAGDCAITISADGFATAQRRAHAGTPLDVDLAAAAKGKTDLTGIGVALEPWKGAAHVIGVLAPSAQQLQPGDVIEQVDGVDAASLGFAGMIASIRGDAGTHVKLKVKRGATEVELDLVRARFTYDGKAPGVA